MLGLGEFTNEREKIMELDNERFLKEHSDISIIPMTTIFLHCQKRRAKSLQEAYDHAFGKDGEHGCANCRKVIEEDKRLSRWAT